jgi:hypothetical protein
VKIPQRVLEYQTPEMERFGVNEISRMRDRLEMLIKFKLTLYVLLGLTLIFPPLFQLLIVALPIWAALFVFELLVVIRLLGALKVDRAEIAMLAFLSSLSLIGVCAMIGIDCYAARRLREEYRRLDALDANRAMKVPLS